MDKPADTSASEMSSSKGAVTVGISVDGRECVSGDQLSQCVSERHVIPSTVGLGIRADKKELLGMVHIPKWYYSTVHAACGDIAEKLEKVSLP
jgi:hypothetical protein